MSVERNFPDFREIKNEVEEVEKERESGEDFSAAWDFIAENFSDPHLNVDINKLTDDDFELAKKFKDEDLTETEIDERLAKLPDGSPSSNFIAAIKNKYTVKEGWRRRTANKLHENR